MVCGCAGVWGAVCGSVGVGVCMWVWGVRMCMWAWACGRRCGCGCRCWVVGMGVDVFCVFLMFFSFRF